MKNLLSIIIPCYNCANTIEEAVSSCFEQGLGDDFEIIMVDDNSTDNTREILNKLKNKYKNIKVYFHEINKGGGAARNTAVNNTTNEVIFCLDSDDSLVPNTLCKMLDYLKKNNLDGTTFSGSYSFSKTKSAYKLCDYKIDLNEHINLDILFSGRSWSAGANFMYTKSAFKKAGGYPEDHSFDTQGFGMRFITNGSKVMTCPNTFFYQRQIGKKESYFERALRNGEFSINYYLILRENIHIFSDKIKDIILNYDIFNNNSLNKNILTDLQGMYREMSGNFFSNKKEVEFDSEYYYKNDNYIKLSESISANKKNYKNLYFDLIKYMFAITNNKKITVRDFKEIISRLQIKKHPYNTLRPNIIQRVIRKVKKIINI